MSKNYYEVLGASKNDSQDEIRKKYRKLAHQYHPDTGKGDEAKFKEISEAYHVIGDEERRKQYDQFGEVGVGGPGASGNYGSGGVNYSGFEDIFSQGFNGFGDFGDIFGDIFGGGRRSGATSQRGVDVEVGMNISFSQAVHGDEVEVSINKHEKCVKCNGTGAEEGKKVITCPRCHGQGQIRQNQNTIFGNMSVSRTCEQCSGLGKVPESTCKVCAGAGRVKANKKLKIKIPAGVSDGMSIKIQGEGEVGYRGSGTGDLYVRLAVEPDPRFQRIGDDIYSNKEITFSQAVLGGQVEIDTIYGKYFLKIPSGTQAGEIIRMKKQGMPKINNSGKGDHFVKIKVKIPTKLSREQKKIIEQLRDVE